VEHEYAMASRRQKVRSARANRTVNAYPTQSNRAEEPERDVDETSLRYETNSAVILVEQNEASPKPICRGVSKDKRPGVRPSHTTGKQNKGVRDRRKLREKRRSTGVMHVPSTESTGGSTGEDENNENSPLGCSSSKHPVSGLEFEEKVVISGKPGQSESDLDADLADDEANNSGDVRIIAADDGELLNCDNEQLVRMLETKDKRISTLEMQVAQLTKQMSEIREENARLLRTLNLHQSSSRGSWKK